MGLLVLALVGAAVLALLWRLGVARPLWSFVGAALMLGGAGYALQGRPTLAGQAARPATETIGVDPELTELRQAMFGRFTSDDAYLIAADAMTRAGEPRAAVQAILGGLRKIPGSIALWTGLGTTLAAHDGGQVSAPALFAFEQAARLAPRHPAPPFFLGLAYVRAGELAKARPHWARALALTPADLSYRDDIALRLALLDRVIALQEAGAAPTRR